MVTREEFKAYNGCLRYYFPRLLYVLKQIFSFRLPLPYFNNVNVFFKARIILFIVVSKENKIFPLTFLYSPFQTSWRHFHLVEQRGKDCQLTNLCWKSLSTRNTISFNFTAASHIKHIWVGREEIGDNSPLCLCQTS